AEVLGSAVFRYSARQLVSLLGRGSDLAAIEINGKSHVALVGEFRCLLFHPVAQAPPFMDDHDPRKGPFALGSVENSLHGFVPAFVGNLFGGGGKRGDGEEKCESQR